MTPPSYPLLSWQHICQGNWVEPSHAARAKGFSVRNKTESVPGQGELTPDTVRGTSI